ncbi:DUF1127 domain-containing protein [Phyllobacterium sp. SB3]|uniref:DUF1127 domain-containing protein n=1 Tax=Phyllobacterium sp. SB3 TaxID=3156073 RepID=UPI0032AF8522
MSTIDTMRPSCQSDEGAGEYSSAPSALMAMLNRVAFALVKRRTRAHLSELTDEQLRDIGVTKSQARQEVARSFWDYEA